MNKQTTCCFTGHRNLPQTAIDSIQTLLHQQVLAAIADGYTHFLCGMANGADLLFASVVAELKKQHSITLEAAIPYEARLKTANPVFQQLVSACDVVKVLSPTYNEGCYAKRNHYMVDNSSRIIAVYNGNKQGGTYATLQYARQSELAVYIIPIAP